ncbi:hypothetical protein TRFO_37055 [Tritrichomonas foetus]|uniref:Uncharacterized protein n=1 Tax=Tritrichomonas foetus TaxID=1144522 RepID=A0A1J4JGY9_9EUKA|nr:hypothetical protein TRFO_37055 [Tritrichomonas foetus]|eukprot:OHS96741.1 hypothetical protein TRFO_37055 [Tritrichomonas foetus]
MDSMMEIPKEGRVSGKIFRTKRMECSLFLFFGLFFVFSSTIFCWFYRAMKDAANFDAYDILTDSIDSNNLNEIDLVNYSFPGLQFKVADVALSPFLTTRSIVKGHYFSSLFDIVYRIRPIRFSRIIETQQISIQYLNNEGETRFTIESFRINGMLQDRECNESFVFNSNYSTYDVNTNTQKMNFLSEVHIKYYFVKADQLFCGFTKDRLIYDETQPTQLLIVVHYASEFLSYGFPSLSFVSVMVFAFIILLLGFVTMLFFLWHCWSYKYVLIKRAILESGVHFER